jgi:ATP-binding protein involved in chromosome partitioning
MMRKGEHHMGNCKSHSGSHGGKCASSRPSEDQKRLAEQLKDIKHKLLVMSGKGGVGKSSVSIYLALGLAHRGYKVGLLDTDFHGPDIARMLGLAGKFHMDEDQRLLPQKYSNNLKMISIEGMLADRDEAVIWRGPMKHGVIRQFISEVNWGKLDFLVIDSPPGTGDEPLSVAQTVTGAQAIVVTTPQEISLADVRKAINFCRKVEMPILGVVENMSGLICPHCGRNIPLFRQGGGQKTAALMGVPFLASLPFDLRVMEGGDLGKPLPEAPDDSPFIQAWRHMVDEVEYRLSFHEAGLTETSEKILSAEVAMPTDNSLKIAVPLAEGLLCNHFGHCERFALIEVRDGQPGEKEYHTPPPHEPGLLPRWLGDLGVNVIIAGGMGQRALSLFNQRGIKVITGAPNLAPEVLVENYLSGSLLTGANVCDH